MMKKELLDIWLYTYLGLIYFVPMIFIIKSKENDNRFFLRRLLFPLEYIIQVRIERSVNYSRSATRLVHILFFIITPYILIPAIAVLILFNETYDNHMTAIMTLYLYQLLATFAFFFQPKSHKSYRTK